MRRQKRFKKMDFPSFVGRLKPLAAKTAVSVTGAVLFFLALFLIGKAFVCNSSYFKLNIVEAKEGFLEQGLNVSVENQLLTLYGGRNVFRLKLKNIAQYLHDAYPDAKEIVARLAFPDKLVVSMRLRKPVALVRDIRTYPVDDECVMLSSVSEEAFKNLPIIEGIDIKYGEKPGKKISSQSLKLALELLSEIRRSRFIMRYGINLINVSDPKGLSFYMKNNVEIRIGGDNFKERLDMLEKTLRDPRLMLDKIKYIDLRFKDVIIGAE